MNRSTNAKLSRLTGAELARVLDYLGVTRTVFARDCDKSVRTVARWVSGEMDGKIPIIADLVLWAYNKDPKMRNRKGRVDLPLEVWLHAPIPYRSAHRGRPPLRRSAPDASPEVSCR